MVRAREEDELLLGEWACLACLVERPAHGFAVAGRLAPDGDLGRVWSLTRPLTYRSIDQLDTRGLVEVVGEERGRNGHVRTVFAATATGRTALAGWLDEPVADLRDARTELVLKLVILERLGLDDRALLARQRAVLAPVVDVGPADSASAVGGVDPRAVWDQEAARAAARFLDRMAARHAPASTEAAGSGSGDAAAPGDDVS